MAIDFNSMSSIITGFDKILKLSSVGGSPPIPTPLVLVGVPRRSGLSPTKIASKIIARKVEAGLPVGALPSGAVSADEIMERIRVEEIVKALQQDASITIAIPPGLTVTAAGTSPAGPVTVVGSSILPFKGYGIIQ
jgi:hypothetical protein